jgi:hypothetical protein
LSHAGIRASHTRNITCNHKRNTQSRSHLRQDKYFAYARSTSRSLRTALMATCTGVMLRAGGTVVCSVRYVHARTHVRDTHVRTGRPHRRRVLCWRYRVQECSSGRQLHACSARLCARICHDTQSRHHSVPRAMRHAAFARAAASSTSHSRLRARRVSDDDRHRVRIHDNTRNACLTAQRTQHTVSRYITEHMHTVKHAE